MLLRDALPRFYAEGTAAIASKPDDELPEGTVRDAILAQFDHLVFIGGSPETGSFRVAMPDRVGVQHGYAFSFDFNIPAGNVIADMDLDLLITGFEPISIDAIRDLQTQLAEVL